MPVNFRPVDRPLIRHHGWQMWWGRTEFRVTGRAMPNRPGLTTSQHCPEHACPNAFAPVTSGPTVASSVVTDP